jgi:hypothetical protein
MRCDGVFPPVSDVTTMPALGLLLAYQQRPMTEGRFSQLEADFVVAPVFLGEVGRIRASPCVGSFALLLERVRPVNRIFSPAGSASMMG